VEELKSEFLEEFRRMQRSAHRLINHLTAISGYTQIAQAQACREPLAEFSKILSTIDTSMAILRNCLMHLKEVEGRYS
jgi:LAS superfamily LD-carboxypeptidase LdcB